MARPFEFNHDEVLHRALEVFWTHGYEASSTARLLDAMGLNRQSLYNTFSSKRGLFLRALEFYQAERAKSLAKTLFEAASPINGIRQLLMSIATLTGTARARGCLSVNTATELGAVDADIGNLLKQGAKRSREDIAQALRQGQELGEFPAELDPKAAANYVYTVMRGLRVATKGGASAAELGGVVGVALAALQARPATV